MRISEDLSRSNFGRATAAWAAFSASALALSGCSMDEERAQTVRTASYSTFPDKYSLALGDADKHLEVRGPLQEKVGDLVIRIEAARNETLSGRPIEAAQVREIQKSATAALDALNKVKSSPLLSPSKARFAAPLDAIATLARFVPTTAQQDSMRFGAVIGPIKDLSMVLERDVQVLQRARDAGHLVAIIQRLEEVQPHLETLRTKGGEPQWLTAHPDEVTAARVSIERLKNVLAENRDRTFFSAIKGDLDQTAKVFDDLLAATKDAGAYKMHWVRDVASGLSPGRALATEASELARALAEDFSNELRMNMEVVRSPISVTPPSGTSSTTSSDHHHHHGGEGLFFYHMSINNQSGGGGYYYRPYASSVLPSSSIGQSNHWNSYSGAAERSSTIPGRSSSTFGSRPSLGFSHTSGARAAGGVSTGRGGMSSGVHGGFGGGRGGSSVGG